VFRGYGFSVLAEWWGTPAALGVTSLVFGLVHLQNAGATLGSVAVVIVAGLFLGAVLVVLRSLWAAFAAHLAWNWALAWFFGLPVSGLKLASHPLLVANDAGPFWLTGGTYGMEGGLACTVAFAVSTLLIWLMPGLKATPELKKLTSEENPAVASPVLTNQPAD